MSELLLLINKGMSASINVYNMPKVLTLTLGGNTGAALMNYPVNTTDFVLVKGITNEILFFVKDTDRHPITANSIANVGITDLHIVITDPDTDNLLLGTQTVPAPEDDPSILVAAPGIDPAKGVWMLSLTANAISSWPTSYLRYSVVCDREIGDQVMLYTDRNYGVYGGLKVIDGPFPLPPEATVIVANSFVFQSASLYSGAKPGAAQLGNISGDMSAVVQMNNFTGSVTVQGSLENEAPTSDSDWFVANVVANTLTAGGFVANTGAVFYTNATTGPAFIEFKGNFMWTRFIVYQSSGTFTEIDYRGN